MEVWFGVSARFGGTDQTLKIHRNDAGFIVNTRDFDFSIESLGARVPTADGDRWLGRLLMALQSTEVPTKCGSTTETFAQVSVTCDGAGATEAFRSHACRYEVESTRAFAISALGFDVLHAMRPDAGAPNR